MAWAQPLSICRRARTGLIAVATLTCGCNSIINGWLDPTVVGNFHDTATLEIRSSLTLEDSTSAIPGAVYPSAEDLEVRYDEYPISPGDTLAIEIYELRQRQVPFQAQAQVSPTGFVNLPVVGRVAASGLTVPEFQKHLRETLEEQEVLREPDVVVEPLFLQQATYSIFGVGVSAANDAPLRAGTFPIRRPDLRILEAINQVGGLNEFVTDIYVFRSDVPPWRVAPPPEPTSEPHDAGENDGGAAQENGAPPSDDQPETRDDSHLSTEAQQEELIDAVEDGAVPSEPTDDQEPGEPVPEMLEPEPADPYIWVDGQFVPNPSFRGGAHEPGPPKPPPFDTITPAVNWARLASDVPLRILRIPAEHLRDGNPEANIVVRPGDTIRIVSGEIGVYYVMGQVNRIGAFAFNAEPITLKAAIAAAGGLSGLAWPDRCTVYRRLGQREQMIQVDLDRIFAGKDSDFYIKRGDIINVGTHPFAPFLQRIRALTLPTPVNNVGYSFTYARNFADIDSFAVQRNPRNEENRATLLP